MPKPPWQTSPFTLNLINNIFKGLVHLVYYLTLNGKTSIRLVLLFCLQLYAYYDDLSTAILITVISPSRLG